MKYPPCPKGVEVFWDNGRFVAVVDDDNGTQRNVALASRQTRRDAILDARAYLDMDNTAYD